MRFAIAWALIGIAVLFTIDSAGRWWWIPVWFAASFFGVAVAYLGGGADLFGKSKDGSIDPLRAVLLAPYLLLLNVTWYLKRLVSPEAPANRLDDTIILSRRLLSNERHPDARTVLDLTAEFSEPRGVREGVEYIAFPILDGSTPDFSALLRILERIEESESPVLIHCAEGHGRTATVAACLLLNRGQVDDANEALDLIRSTRPFAWVSSAQRAFVEEFANRKASNPNLQP